MSESLHGERAFPVVGELMQVHANGMSLRDYFAAKIVAALCTGPDGGVNPTKGSGESWQQTTARCAYVMADAMLEARSKK